MMFQRPMNGQRRGFFGFGASGAPGLEHREKDGVAYCVLAGDKAAVFVAAFESAPVRVLNEAERAAAAAKVGVDKLPEGTAQIVKDGSEHGPANVIIQKAADEGNGLLLLIRDTIELALIVPTSRLDLLSQLDTCIAIGPTQLSGNMVIFEPKGGFVADGLFGGGTSSWLYLGIGVVLIGGVAWYMTKKS